LIRRLNSLVSLLSVLRAPRSPRFPYTTLFRSVAGAFRLQRGAQLGQLGRVRRWLCRSRSGRCRLPRQLIHAATNPFQRQIDALRSEEHTSELQSRENLVCRLLLEKKKTEELLQ